ncbi:hypothetical protein J6V86_00005, partial [bacterium]|nr:hypothetical protein [bacterium]
NHDINQTERKNTTTIHINTRIVFKIILPIDFFPLLCCMFLGEERLDDLKSLFLLIINTQKTNKIQNYNDDNILDNEVVSHETSLNISSPFEAFLTIFKSIFHDTFCHWIVYNTKSPTKFN